MTGLKLTHIKEVSEVFATATASSSNADPTARKGCMAGNEQKRDCPLRERSSVDAVDAEQGQMSSLVIRVSDVEGRPKDGVKDQPFAVSEEPQQRCQYG